MSALAFEGHMSENTEAKEKTKFWERPHILRAVQVHNVWASCAHHWMSGGQGIPTLDWITGKHEKDLYQKITRRGHVWVKGQRKLISWQDEIRQTFPSTCPDGKLPAPILLYFGVEELIASEGKGRLLRRLLLHRYPCGDSIPLAHSEPDRAYRKFRPKFLSEWLELAFGPLAGQDALEWKIDQLLAQMERDWLQYAAGQI